MFATELFLGASIALNLKMPKARGCEAPVLCPVASLWACPVSAQGSLETAGGTGGGQDRSEGGPGAEAGHGLRLQGLSARRGFMDLSEDPSLGTGA